MKHIILALTAALFLAGCYNYEPTSDAKMAEMQEKALDQAVSAVGMPNIVNFREKRLLKTIYELRDQEGLRTYTYLIAQNTGERKFLCDSIGFPLNDAIGYSSPERITKFPGGGRGLMIQAEPNALFTPDSSNSYWVLCLDTEAGKPSPVFVTGYPVVSTFKLN